MPRSPSARTVPRVLGFVPMIDFTCVTLSIVITPPQLARGRRAVSRGSRRAGQRDREHVLLGLFDGLLHGESGFLGLAVAEPDLAVPVTDDHQGGEGEPTTALDDLGDAVDPADGSLFEICHLSAFLELEA